MNKLAIIYLLPIFVCSNLKTSAQTNTLIYKNYCNDRYGYCIDYPKDLIYPQPISTNGDGRVFKNTKAEEILKVYGTSNAKAGGGNISLEQQYSDDLHEISLDNTAVITYQKLGNDFFVISGYMNKKIFYRKTILKDNAFCYAIMMYDENSKVLYNKVADRVFKSFK